MGKGDGFLLFLGSDWKGSPSQGPVLRGDSESDTLQDLGVFVLLPGPTTEGSGFYTTKFRN